jgi:hypothetical protein
MADPTAHSELLEYAPSVNTPIGSGGHQFLGDTINISTAHDTTGLSLWPVNLSSFPGSVGTVDAENNFIVIGWAGGMTFPGGATSGTVNGSVTGDVFTVGSGLTSGATIGNGPIIDCIPTSTFSATIDNGSGTGTPSGNELTVTTAPTNVPLVIGTAITGTGVPGGANILSQVSGTAGGVGVYTLDVSAALTSRTITGNSGSLSFAMVYDGSTGTTSAGPGGGGNGGVGSQWHMDLNSTANLTGYIDDGVGPGYDGNPGNVLTVTFDEAMDLSLSGLKINGLTLTPIAGATGIGQYTVSGAASVVSPGIFTAVPMDHQRGGWQLPAGATAQCLATGYGAIPWTHALGDTASGGTTQITWMNNFADLGVFGTDNDIWSQRSGVNSFTGTITGGTALAVTGVTGSIGIGSLVLPNPLVATNTFIASGASPNFVISPSQANTSGAMHSIQPWCLNPTIFGGNEDMSGTHANINTWTSTVAGSQC